MITIFRVEVAGKVKEYPADIAGYGTWRAQGGSTVSLSDALHQTKWFFAGNKDDVWEELTFWAILDDSGLAYLIGINRYQELNITAAAPLPGVGNVQDVYRA